jgi:hypothetical protein
MVTVLPAFAVIASLLQECLDADNSFFHRIGATVPHRFNYSILGVAHFKQHHANTHAGIGNPPAMRAEPREAGNAIRPARNALKQPFSSFSIWNMPIGSGAVYVPARISDNPAPGKWVRMPQADEEHIVLKPNAPPTTINYSSAGWKNRASRCRATGNALMQVPMPSDYVVPTNIENSVAAFLLADGRTIAQTQPFARCTAGGYATSWVTFPNVDLYGDGRTGAHGGSGLSAIGGSLRVGELRPGGQGPSHALKVNVYATQALYKCTTQADCFRWPASSADSSAVGRYGTNGNNQNKAMKMGALLALPSTLNIASLGLETEPAKQLAWTLQNYGAYIVDDTGAPQFAFNTENGPDGSFKAQFQSDYGFPFEQLLKKNTPWVRDIRRLVKALHVVDNNGPNSIGGGGTPLQPMALPLQPPEPRSRCGPC